MLRFMYLRIIWAHPRAFRRQFGSEMIWIFDQDADRRMRMSLLADALISVIRQRWLRPMLSPLRPAAQTAGIPAFTSLDTSLPPTMLLWGAVVSLLLVLAAAAAPGSGRPAVRGHRIRPFSESAQQRARGPEAHFSFANALQRIWSAIAVSFRGSASSKPVLVPTLAASDSQPPVPVRPERAADVLLGMLDTDGDMILTRAELKRTPGVLLLLDANIDGLLTWRECETGRDYLNVLRLPSRLFAAIDSTRNGAISRGERLLGADALAELDTDGDGRLTRREWEEKQ